jgi:hypothetical protein
MFNPKSNYLGIDSFSQVESFDIWLLTEYVTDAYVEKQIEKDIYFHWQSVKM